MENLHRLTGLLLCLLACNCGSSESDPAQACAPGQSIACVGPAGCAGYQVCKSDASGYDACSCEGSGAGGSGSGTTSSSASASTTSIAAGGGSATSSSAGSGGGGSGAGGELAPNQIPGLSLWLDSSIGTTTNVAYPDQVSVWADQSGHGNNAHSNNYQEEPTLKLSAFKSFDVLNFSIGGSSSQLHVTDDPSLRFGAGDFAVVFVMKEPSIQAATLWVKGAGLQITADVNINVLTATGSAHAFLPNPSTAFHVVAVRGPAPLEIRVDGVATVGTTSTTNLDETGAEVFVGAGGGANNFSEIEYLQVLAYKGAVSDTQIEGLELYLTNLYGL